MALQALKSLMFRMEAPAGLNVGMPKFVNPTNHLRYAAGGAFTLPSDGWIPQQQTRYPLMRSMAR
jgi:hypothetical protein